MAATVRVGHAVGRDDAAGSRRAGLAAIGLGAAFMTAMGVVVIATRHLIPLLFLRAGEADAKATAALAATLLSVGATFYIADGMQTIAAGALRGLNDTRVPLFFAAVSFWGVGFATSYSLAFPAHLGAVGIWAGFTVGLGVYATAAGLAVQYLVPPWLYAGNARTRHAPLTVCPPNRLSAKAKHDRTTDHHQPRPPWRRPGGNAGRAGLRALYAAGRDGDGRARARPSRPAPSGAYRQSRATSAPRRSASISASAAAARCSIGRSPNIICGSAGWSPRRWSSRACWRRWRR